MRLFFIVVHFHPSRIILRFRALARLTDPPTIRLIFLPQIENPKSFRHLTPYPLLLQSLLHHSLRPHEHQRRNRQTKSLGGL